jgi:mono/diheme cytochrome c family protein
MIDALYRFLRNLGFTDPLHPPIVHVPIGLVIGALVFFAVALAFKRRQLVPTARHVSILALVFAFPSILFGAFDWIHFYRAAMIPAILIKIVLAAALLVLLVLGIILGGKGKSPNAAILAIYALSFLDVVGLGYFGATLVYGQGAALASTAGGASEAKAAPSADGSGAGSVLFESNCQACHPGGGNSVAPKYPVKGSKRMESLGRFEAFLRAPTMPDGGEGEMPAYGADALSSGQVKELYAFVTRAYK